MRRILWIAFLPVFAPLACSSSSDSGGGNTGGGGDVVISDKVSAVSGASVDTVIVAADRLTFPVAGNEALLQKKPGDILLGDPSATSKTNPFGFTRKVKSVAQNGDTIVVMTDPALLNEVVRQGTFQATLQTPDLGASGPAAQSHTMNGLHTESNGGPITLLDWSGRSIFKVSKSATVANGHTIGFDANATLQKATLTFTPSWDVGAKISINFGDPLSSVKEFHVIGNGKLDADLEISSQLNVTSNATGDDLAQLIAQQVFQSQSTTLVDYPVKLGQINVGFVHIPVNAEFKVNLLCDFHMGGNVSVMAGAQASAQVQAGFKYQNGQGVSPVWSHSESFTPVGPNFTLGGEAGVKCTLKPEFDIKFWDLAAAEIWATPYVAMDANAECVSGTLNGNASGEAYAGVAAAAHAKVDVFGLYQWEKACTLYQIDSPHAKVSTTFTLPGQSTSQCKAPPSNAPQVSQDQPPPSCFGTGNGQPPDAGGGGGGGGGGSDGGATGDGGSCNPNGYPAPQGWTCDAAKYGDCNCDCNCGATDMDCSVGQCSGCTHDACTEGDPLGTSCTNDKQGGACIQAICAHDSYCCEFAWSASCVAHVKNGDYGCTPQQCP